ncbi:MAG: hypothetical protein DMF83_10645 [Acidobacteria bacterium]|nr:MAG: hypothetical protein DMF83_10645 [Acidobacteriota bacterium]
MAVDTPREWLHQEWVHSHEEDRDDEMVFRPASFKFPPSRGRRSIDLRRDGTVGHARPGPDDRRQRSAGRWEIDGHALKLFPATGKTPAEVYRITSASPDRLVLRSG